MDLTWYEIHNISITAAPFLAQTEAPFGLPIPPEIWDFILRLLGAVAILIAGWIIAVIAAAVVQAGLKRTQIDNRLAAWVFGDSQSDDAPFPIEKWLAAAVYWIVLLLAVIGCLQVLGLEAVSQPLNDFIQEITTYAPRILSAGVLLAVAFLLATIVKLVLTRGLQQFSLDDKLAQQMGGDSQEGGSPFLVNETLGNILYWLILLLFLPFVLDALNLQGPLAPVQNMIDQVLSALPKIFKAAIIFGLGWIIARIVRGIATNFLAATGADSAGTKFGLKDTDEEGPSVSGIVGTLVYTLILIITAISALQELQIEAIFGPAIAMLQEIVSAIPEILRAGLILLVAFVIARFVSELVTNLLTSFGFNNVFVWLGVQDAPTAEATAPAEGEPAGEGEATSTPKTPSEFVGILVIVGIMLFAAVEAVNALQFTALTDITQQIIEIGGRVLYGVIVFAIGLYLANLAFRLITMSNTSQSRTLGHAARIAILALVGAMALQQMGIATDIVNLAFGLLLGAVAVAIALAFGLGGRDIAAEQIREWLNSFKQGQ